jgi:hypothetical protein
MGVIQALISIYAESGDKIRSIIRGRHKIVFLLRPPVFLFCTSDWGEPDFVVSTSRVSFIDVHSRVGSS